MKAFEIKNLKQYIADILIFLILCLSGFILSEKPKINLTAPKKNIAQAEQKPEIKRHKIQTDDIMERNLFTMDGKYTDTMQKPPENPYNLVAVMIGSEKKAVFKDYTGKLFTAKEKEKMIDGYTIKKIGENSVILKRGKQQKELKILIK